MERLGVTVPKVNVQVPTPFVGNTSDIRDLETCRKDYAFLMKTQKYYHAQNPMIAPTAHRYVQALVKQSPRLVSNVADKLAVVTGVFYDSVGYHVALELACLGAHVIIMARRQSNLSECIEAIEEEAARRGVNSPILYQQTCDQSSLQSVKAAADSIVKIAVSKYLGKLSLLVHTPATGTAECKLTKDKIEYNFACNFVAPHYLTKQLLRLLEAASTERYKARVLFSSSIGHCLGVKFNPLRIEDFPEEGGAPAGYIVFDQQSGTIRENHAPAAPPRFAKYWQQLTQKDASQQVEQADLAVVGTQYGRAKYAVIADAAHMSKLFPKVCVVSYHSGSIRTEDVNIVGNMFRFTASQGARAPLRASLDPAFNSTDDDSSSLQGAYLHCDGNPWHPELPVTKDPDTGKAFEWDAYAQCCYEAVERLLAKLADRIQSPPDAAVDVSNSGEESSSDEEDDDDEEEQDEEGSPVGGEEEDDKPKTAESKGGTAGEKEDEATDRKAEDAAPPSDSADKTSEQGTEKSGEGEASEEVNTSTEAEKSETKE